MMKATPTVLVVPHTTFTDEDIRSRRDEYATALRDETQASVSVREMWSKLVAMLDQLERLRDACGVIRGSLSSSQTGYASIIDAAMSGNAKRKLSDVCKDLAEDQRGSRVPKNPITFAGQIELNKEN
jgi:hypothetical protein